MHTTTKRLSAAHLTAPKGMPKLQPVAAISVIPPRVDTASLFGALRAQIDYCGPKPNRHDLVTSLIEICIDQGVTKSGQIIGILVSIEFNPRHVAMMLRDGKGTDPERHRWRRRTDGSLELIA